MTNVSYLIWSSKHCLFFFHLKIYIMIIVYLLYYTIRFVFSGASASYRCISKWQIDRFGFQVSEMQSIRCWCIDLLLVENFLRKLSMSIEPKLRLDFIIKWNSNVCHNRLYPATLWPFASELSAVRWSEVPFD